MANMTCPICKGSGKNIEDSNEYEFITRDPITKRCLFCDGSGKIAPMKVLPNGLRACDMKPDRKKLNVSLKDKIIADLTPEKKVDTGLGYVPESKEDALPTAIETLTPDPSPRTGEGSQDGRTQSAPTRLNKVLASGKEFLIVTETEPYYLEVYRMIRNQERFQGTWTVQDEGRYVEVLEQHIYNLERRLFHSGLPKHEKKDREVVNG